MPNSSGIKRRRARSRNSPPLAPWRNTMNEVAAPETTNSKSMRQGELRRIHDSRNGLAWGLLLWNSQVT